MVVVGLKNCSKCEDLKEKLTKEGTSFDYREFKDLPLIAQRKISKRFRDDSGAIAFPVVIENESEYKL
jgi:glutaredoxin